MRTAALRTLRRRCAIFVMVTAFFSTLALALPAAADTPCPANGNEEGGLRTCFDTPYGHVYVWKPGNYDPTTAITVVHVHGYNKYDKDGSSNHYVDEVWRLHHMARKFNKSGINALFIVPESYTDNGTGRHWPSLTSLLGQVNAHSEPTPQNVAVETHSGGIFSVMQWLSESRIQHIILLDSVYGNAPGAISNWFKGSSSRMLTITNA